MSRGFVILAQNTLETDYVKCAEVLAMSIMRNMPDAKVSIITTDKTSSTVWDKVIALPYGDLAPNNDWKLSNDWQVYEASPYNSTIKLEADMYLPKNIDHWWNILEQQDVVVSTTIRNYKNEVSTVRLYRKFIDDNALPDCYNAITYFKKSDFSRDFFALVREIFENWESYKEILKCNAQEPATTDWVYALACHIVGLEKTTMPTFTEMSMIHMKQYISNIPTENWTDTLVYECLPNQIRVHTYPQHYPFHYHVKTFSDKILKGMS